MSDIFERAFRPYDRIADSPSCWRASRAEHLRLQREPWLATEKVHGANISILTDGRELRFARRKALLREGERFFDVERLRPRLEAPILALAAPLLARAPIVAIYGELFGGAYPHPAVPASPGLKPVQTGVYYHPELRFLAFDIALCGPDERVWLDIDEALARCGAAGLPAIEVLARGRLSELQRRSPSFPSTLPARFGLPDLGPENLAEGYVLRPQRTVLVETPKGLARPLLKRKPRRFAEDPRYHEAEAPRVAPPGIEAYALDWLAELARPLINSNRIAAARSKVGPDDPAALTEELLDDVFEALGGAAPQALAALSAEERGFLRAWLAEAAAPLAPGG